MRMILFLLASFEEANEGRRRRTLPSLTERTRRQPPCRTKCGPRALCKHSRQVDIADSQTQ